MAEGAGLENRYTLTGIVGSNPTLSVFPQELSARCPTGWDLPPILRVITATSFIRPSGQLHCRVGATVQTVALPRLHKPAFHRDVVRSFPTEALGAT